MSTREILYRGKRTNNGKWVEGLPSYDEDGNITEIEAPKMLKEGYFIDVDPETIGQYTGLTDKNGRKIFEGDILRSDDNKIGQVQWFEEHSAFMIWNVTENKVHFLYDNDFSKIEVIGNIFDNPELIEQEVSQNEK